MRGHVWARVGMSGPAHASNGEVLAPFSLHNAPMHTFLSI